MKALDSRNAMIPAKSEKIKIGPFMATIRLNGLIFNLVMFTVTYTYKAIWPFFYHKWPNFDFFQFSLVSGHSLGPELSFDIRHAHIDFSLPQGRAFPMGGFQGEAPPQKKKFLEV